jgi:signal peptidase I
MKKSLVSFFETLAISIFLCLTVMLFVAQSLKVSGSSMIPTLENGERIIVEKVSLKTSSLKRNDIIVFRDQQRSDYFLIKRVIAIPGDIVEIKEDKLVLNGKLLDDSYTLNGSHFDRMSVLEPFLGSPLPNEKYLVFGDNRDDSFDSRNFGPIDKKNIVGRAFLIYWPMQDFKKL